MRLLLAALSALALAIPTLAQDKPKLDPEVAKLAGVWKVASTSGHGKTVTARGNTDEFGKPLWGNTTFTIDGDRLTTFAEPVVLPDADPKVGLYFAIYGESKFRVRARPAKEKQPAEIDLVMGKNDNVILKGIYELNGDELKLCVTNWLYCSDKDEEKMAKNAKELARPTSFESKGGEYVFYVLTREKK